ncbi:MAG: hypothetical protein AB1512_11115 [Thermodesulfobacteriota bacterium]
MTANAGLRKALLESLTHLEPADDVDESLRKLLMAKARSDLLKYEVMCRAFEKKYKMDFDAFRTSDFMKEPPSEVEQDYFDWELAVTRMGEVKSQLAKLAAINESL